MLTGILREFRGAHLQNATVPLLHLRRSRTLRQWVYFLHFGFSGYPDYDGGSQVTQFAAQMISPDNSMREVYKGQDLDCIVAGLLPGRPYLFQVRAFNRAGVSTFSALSFRTRCKVQVEKNTHAKQIAVHFTCKFQWWFCSEHCICLHPM